MHVVHLGFHASLTLPQLHLHQIRNVLSSVACYLCTLVVIVSLKNSQLDGMFAARVSESKKESPTMVYCTLMHPDATRLSFFRYGLLYLQQNGCRNSCRMYADKIYRKLQDVHLSPGVVSIYHLTVSFKIV